MIVYPVISGLLPAGPQDSCLRISEDRLMMLDACTLPPSMQDRNAVAWMPGAVRQKSASLLASRRGSILAH